MDDPSQDDICNWLVDEIARLLAVERGKVEIDTEFDTFGLGSVEIAEVTTKLEDWLDCEVPPTLPFEFPSIEAIARELARGRESGT